jgi:hypothetical protein
MTRAQMRRLIGGVFGLVYDWVPRPVPTPKPPR